MAPKRRAKVRSKQVAKKAKLSEEEETQLSPTQNNTEPKLTRTNTLILTNENETNDTTLQKSISLQRSRSSLSKSLFDNGQIDILETNELSFEAKQQLEKKLSSILLPASSRNEIIVNTCKVIDEDSRQFQIDLTHFNEETDSTSLDDLPPELLVLIFDELELDEDKWRFAKVNKKFYAIFRLYVGWNYLNIISDKGLLSINEYCEIDPNLIGISTDETYFVIPPQINLEINYESAWERSLNVIRVPENVYYLYNSVKHIAYHTLGTTLVSFHPSENSTPQSNSVAQFFVNRLFSLRENENPLPNRKVISIVPFMEDCPNEIPSLFFADPYFDLLLGEETFIDKDIHGNAKEYQRFERMTGVDRKSNFVTVKSTINSDRKVNVQMLFNVKEFNRFYHEGVELSRIVKIILLRLLQVQTFTNGLYIKWTLPNSKIMRSVRPAIQPSNLKLKLYSYQQCGLAWMMDIEKNILKRKYKFSKVIKAPGYPVIDFLMFAGPYAQEDSSLDFRIVSENELNEPDAHPDLFDIFTVRGGIMADEMGLGKTITILSLILSNPRTKTEDGKLIIEDRDEAVFESKSSLVICPNQLIAQWKNELTNHCHSPLTIISIFTMNDIKALTYQDVVESDVVIISHQFLKNGNYLKNCGKLSTLLSRAKKNKSKIKITKLNPILQHIGWQRIILDEGHEVLSSPEKAEGKELFGSFLSNYRWYVTGTPVPRGRDSIVGLLNFLSISITSSSSDPFSLDEKQKHKTGAYEMCLFTAVKENLFWRNTKEKVNDQAFIPNIVESIEFLSFSPYEQALYDAAAVASDLDDLRLICTQPKEAEILKGVSEVKKISECSSIILAKLKKKISDLRLKLPNYKGNLKDLCAQELDTKLQLNAKIGLEPPIRTHRSPYTNRDELTKEFLQWRNDKQKAEKTLNNLQDKILSAKRKIANAEDNIVLHVSQAACFSRLISDNDEEVCKLCNKKAVDREVTLCGHSFCAFCVTSFVRRNSHCPTCNSSLSLHQIFPPTQNLNEISDNSPNHISPTLSPKKKKEIYDKIGDEFGTKIAAIIKRINEILSSDPSHKIIVFSKWEILLTKLGHLLDKTFQPPDMEDSLMEDDRKPIHVSCKGNAIVKTRIIEQFNNLEKNSPRVLFLSLTSAASGTHLTVATHILLVDPPAGTKEESIAYDSQAIARSHRIGQDKSVTVIRFIIENSIDHKDYLSAYGSE